MEVPAGRHVCPAPRSAPAHRRRAKSGSGQSVPGTAHNVGAVVATLPKPARKIEEGNAAAAR